jgi:hypothetical protein
VRNALGKTAIIKNSQQIESPAISAKENLVVTKRFLKNYAYVMERIRAA